MTKPSLSWIKQITNIAQSQEIPQWGQEFRIDFSSFAKKLEETLSTSGLEIRKVASAWLPKEEIHSGLGMKPSLFSIELQPIGKKCALAISNEERKKLLSFFLSPSEKKKAIHDAHLEEAFYEFCLLRTLCLIEKSGLFPGCSLHRAETQAIAEEESFCIDIALHKENNSLFFRLICPKEFHEAFRAFFLQQQKTLSFDSSIPLPLSCVIGNANLALKEWKSVQVGDCLLLDLCSYDPLSRKGNVDIYTYGKKILHTRLKPNGLKVIDFSDFFEEVPMDDDDFLSEDEKFDFEEEEKQDAPMPAEQSLSSLSQIPLNVQVEVARFSMPLEKILQLSSGNVIETGVYPEQGVFLIVNGKPIAKAELIKIGERIGVKILEMGEP